MLESPRQASRQIDRWTDRQADKKIKGQDTDRQICCRRWWYYDVIPVWPSSEEEAVKVFLEGGVPLTCHLLSFPRVEGWECWRQLRRMLRCFSCGLVFFLYIHSYRFTGLTLYMLIEVSQRGEMVLNPRFQFSLWVSQMPWEYKGAAAPAADPGTSNQGWLIFWACPTISNGPYFVFQTTSPAYLVSFLI